MESAILAELRRSDPPAARPGAALAPYERRTLTRRLAGVFDLVTEDTPALSRGAGRHVASRSA